MCEGQTRGVEEWVGGCVLFCMFGWLACLSRAVDTMEGGEGGQRVGSQKNPVHQVRPLVVVVVVVVVGRSSAGMIGRFETKPPSN